MGGKFGPYFKFHLSGNKFLKKQSGAGVCEKPVCGAARCASQVLDCGALCSGRCAVVHRGYFIVVPKPMPAAPRRYLIVVARRLPAAVVCHRKLSRFPGRCPNSRSLSVAGT